MRYLLAIWFVLWTLFSSASIVDRKEIAIDRTDKTPEIDGDMNEPAWNDISMIEGFVQNTPYPGQAASQPTQVKISYDDHAIFVVAKMFESDKDSITATLSQRDDLDNADYFGVILDPYGAGLNGFGFFVTAAGVQRDVRYNGDYADGSLNMVWESRVKIEDDGWTVEMRIPYSAIRFPKESAGDWRVNFVRRIRRIRETSYWNPVDPQKFGLLNQSAVLSGIDSVKAPVRLAFFPYVSAYLEHYPYDDPLIQNTSYTFNGGMDLKYGLSESFTLDMTLIPDFGQVQFDNQVLNLSPFEVRFNERRQFFTEGTELYNIGGLFYSRRVGGTPINFSAPYQSLDSSETVVENPTESRLLNATKVSGRTKSGLGIGVFNGLTSTMYATIENTEGEQRTVQTDPLTNYSVFVLDQNLKNNSSVSLVNTNVMRSGEAYDANVTGGYFTFQNKSQQYGVSGGLSVSQKYYPDSVNIGHRAGLAFGKVAGRFTGDVNYSEESDSYDINDLGFLTNNNNRNFSINLRYAWFDPFWRLMQARIGLNMWHSRLYSPDVYTGAGFNIDGNVTWKNFLTTGGWINVRPMATHDYFEPRVWGRYFANPANVNLGGYYSTDYSRPLALDIRSEYRVYDREDRHDFKFMVSPRIRIGDKLMFIYSFDRLFQQNNEGAAIQVATGGGTIIGDTIVFAKRDRTTITNTVNLNYIFTNRMGLTFRLRHYWSKVDYNSFHVLQEDGGLSDFEYDGLDQDGVSLHNNSFNAFTIDMVYRWVFAPGSEMSVVWKNSIFTSNTFVNLDYFTNVDDLMSEPQTNSLSIKILYYLDYAMITKRTARVRN